MPAITANDLKTRGIAAIEESLAHDTEAMVSVRGQPRFVVMEVAQYHYLRECELDAALAQSQADLAAGRYVAQSAKQHMERIEAQLADTGAAKAARKPTAGKTVAARAGRRPARS